MAAGGPGYTVAYAIQLIDNITATTDRMEGRLKSLETQQERTRSSTDSQNISFIAQMTAVSGVHRGLTRATSSMRELGLLSEKDAAAMMKFNAAVGLVAGTFQMLKGAVQIINMVRSAEVALAGVETFRAVLRNPAAMVLVGTAIGAAGGAIGWFMGQGAGTTNIIEQNVTYQGGGDRGTQRGIARDTFEMMGG